MPANPTDPMGLDGFEFVEFVSPDPAAMQATFELMGFVHSHTRPDGQVIRMKQGDITFLINKTEGTPAAEFRAAHGPSAAGMAFRVKDAKQAFDLAVKNGATPAEITATGLGDYPFVLQGIGGSLLYLVDQWGDATLYDGWTQVEGWQAREAENNVGLTLLDHLTHNVHKGQMRTWSTFYGNVFGFTEQKYFDIKGKATGLFSQAMVAPDGMIRIPLNESQDEQSQIQEFLTRYNGEGIQHIALHTDDIFETVEEMKRRGVPFQDTIETYFDLIDKRLPGHGHDVDRMRANRILIDGSDQDGLLLQIFTQDTFGPIFFEIIQRKGNEGFGNGNFQALFDSIELDQIRRGVIKVDA